MSGKALADASELGSTVDSEGGGEPARDFLQDSSELNLDGGREGWYTAKQRSWRHVLLACGGAGSRGQSTEAHVMSSLGVK